jgi:carboxyl-terminal processing protease
MHPSVRTAVIALASAVLFLFAGMYLGGHPNRLPDSLRDAFVADKGGSLRGELIEEIDNDFYREVDRKKLEEASLQGIIAALDDPFSHYFTPDQSELFEQSVSGEFEGVGMSVDQDKRGLLVVQVFEGSPAADAGIRKGDIVTSVDSDPIAGEPSDVAVAKIKGEAGSMVELKVVTPGQDGERTVEVERERIEVPVVEGRIVERKGRRLGVAKFLSFSRGSHGLLREEIDGLLDEGAEGLVLDLRGNGGGLLDEGILVASTFIEDGEIVSTRGRTRAEREFEAEGDAIEEDIPVVVLVDRGTASASEIVAGALQDRGRATVVGTKTFGKGVVQEVETLSNGGTLSLTVASYYLPSGVNISDKGIEPRIRARDKPRTKRDEAEPVALDALLEALK